MKKLIRFLTSRLFHFTILILLQAGLFCIGLFWLWEYSAAGWLLLQLLSGLLVVFIVSWPDNPAYKLAWVILILGLPGFGCFFFLAFSRRSVSPRLQRTLRQVEEKAARCFPERRVLPTGADFDPTVSKTAAYLQKTGPFPVFSNTETVYLTPGEEKFRVLCQELEKARHFIFLEYFIIEKGVMWDTVLAILLRKLREGVEVRVLYDDLGCIQTLPPKYDAYLRQFGIQVEVFNRYRPFLDLCMGYRDHRKICIIDGNAAITGGINLADEYINVREKHGYWKDAALLLRGEGVRSLCRMFLTLWETCSGTEEDYTPYLASAPAAGKGLVLPFCDSPLDSELVSKSLYLSMIQSAARSVRIQTPYLILDNEIATALALAAKSGVLVEIFTPCIGDKWYVQELTRANYPQLLRAGVHIYEYTPGFLHSKVVSADEASAVVGSCNFDFRSLYLHFECGVWMYRTAAVEAVEEDFQVIRTVSREVKPEDCRLPWHRSLVRKFLQVFAPLM